MIAFGPQEDHCGVKNFGKVLTSPDSKNEMENGKWKTKMPRQYANGLFRTKRVARG